MNLPHTLLIVCDTNLSLSPVLERMLQQRAPQELTILSRGSHCGASRSVPPICLSPALEIGIDLSSHHSVQLTQGCLSSVTHIYTMNENNFWFSKSLLQEESNIPIDLVTKTLDNLGLREIADPLMGEQSFEEAYTLLAKCADAILAKI